MGGLGESQRIHAFHHLERCSQQFLFSSISGGKLRRKRSQMTFDRLTKVLSTIEKIEESNEDAGGSEKSKIKASNSAPEMSTKTNNSTAQVADISRHDLSNRRDKHDKHDKHGGKPPRDSLRLRKADLEQKLPKGENLRRTSIAEMDEDDEGKGSSKNSTPEPPSLDHDMANNVRLSSRKLASSMEELLLEKEEPVAQEEVQLDPAKLPSYMAAEQGGAAGASGDDLPFGKKSSAMMKRVSFTPGRDKPAGGTQPAGADEKKDDEDDKTKKEEKKYVYDGKPKRRGDDEPPPPDEML